MSRDPRIDSYIETSQPFARPILSHIRERVHAAVPDVEETLKWSAPAFTLDGKILLGMSAFKEHAALSFWLGKEVTGSSDDRAMGQFGRLTSASDLPPDDELEKFIRKAAELSGKGRVQRKPKSAAKPPAALHADFTTALAKAPKARATFDAFSPSCRREYADWINEAKRDETRDRRIATAIEWLSEGKKRHWKYENC